MASPFARTASHSSHDLIISIFLASTDSRRRASLAIVCQKIRKILTNVSYTPPRRSCFLPFRLPVQPSILSNFFSSLHQRFSIAPRRPKGPMAPMTCSALSSASGTCEDYTWTPSAFQDAKSQNYSQRRCAPKIQRGIWRRCLCFPANSSPPTSRRTSPWGLSRLCTLLSTPSFLKEIMAS